MQRPAHARRVRPPLLSTTRRTRAAVAPFAAVLLTLATVPAASSAAAGADPKGDAPPQVTLTAPRVVAVGSNGKPKSLTVKAIVHNAGVRAVRAVAVRLDVPAGLTLVKGRERAGLGTLAAGAKRSARWRIRARPNCKDRTYKLTATAHATRARSGRTAARASGRSRSQTATVIVHGTCARAYGVLAGYDETGGHPLAGAQVELCETDLTGCTQKSTDASGRYEFLKALPAGQNSHAYRIRAHGHGAFTTPATQTSAATVMVRGGDHRRDFAWERLTRLDSHTQLPGAGSQGDVPIWHYMSPQPLHIDGCPPGVPGMASYVLIGQDPVGFWTGSIMMTHNLDGSFDAIIPPPAPHHGPAILEITLVCDGRVTVTKVNVYIDPSGVVHNTRGRPIAGATVTLYRHEGATLGFQQVPDGSAVMSPANRRNTDLTDAAGHFGWDVLAGVYKVRAEKAGCHAPGSAVPYVETAALTIPPPVIDIDLILQCTPL